MRGIRVLILALVAALAVGGVSSAAADETLRPHHLKEKGMHWDAEARPGKPGIGSTMSMR